MLRDGKSKGSHWQLTKLEAGQGDMLKILDELAYDTLWLIGAAASVFFYLLNYSNQSDNLVKTEYLDCLG